MRPIFVCDLEATCWDDGRHYTVDDTEIIEIGCVLATPKGDILDEFCSFVRPIKDPVLSEFCKSLTSIRQSDVDSAPTYFQAMKMLDKWVAGRRAIWGSWGNYDFREFMAMERRHLTGSKFLQMQHVNLKRSWKKTTGSRLAGLRNALSYHGLEFQGSHHRGIDDARNITRLLQYIDYDKLLAGLGILNKEQASLT